MATVKKRTWTYNGKSKSAFVVRYVGQDGKRCQQSFDRYAVADKYRLKVETEIERGVHVPLSQSVTVQQAAQEWLNDCERRARIGDNFSYTALALYRNFTLNHVCGKFGAIKLVELAATPIQKWLNELSEVRSRAFLEKCHLMLGQIISYSVRNNYVGRNVMVEGKVRIPAKRQERVKIPNIQQLTELLQASEQREFNEKWVCLKNRRVIIRLGAYCGMRRGEIAGLQWSNVDFEKHTIRIRHAMSLHDGLKGPKSKAGVRDLHVPPQLLVPLKDLHRSQGYPSDGHVILTINRTRLQPSQVYRLWIAVARKAGLVDEHGVPLFHLHALRHAAASMLIAEGASPLHVKTFLGHASITTTMDIYGHLFPDDMVLKNAMRAAADRISVAQESSKTPQLAVV